MTWRELMEAINGFWVEANGAGTGWPETTPGYSVGGRALFGRIFTSTGGVTSGFATNPSANSRIPATGCMVLAQIRPNDETPTQRLQIARISGILGCYYDVTITGDATADAVNEALDAGLLRSAAPGLFVDPYADDSSGDDLAFRSQGPTNPTDPFNPETPTTPSNPIPNEVPIGWTTLPVTTTPADVFRAAQMETIEITNVAALRVAEIVGETPAFWAGWRGNQWVIPTCRNVPILGCLDSLAVDNMVPLSDINPARAANQMGLGGTTVDPNNPTQTPTGTDFSVPGLVPIAPSIIQVRRCPGRTVLAVNGMCYDKRILPAALRENRSRRAPVSYSDAQAIRRGNTAARRIEQYANTNQKEYRALTRRTRRRPARRQLRSPRRRQLPFGEQS